MSQEIEIEFKNLLTKDEYYKIKETFKIEEHDFFDQENHYFDTPEFSLKAIGAALRIRRKQNKFVMTLKEPATVGLLETHQTLSDEMADSMMKTGELVNGEVVDRLLQLDLDVNKITYFGSLSTRRAEKNFQNGLIVLDHSRYLTVEDYELEYEAKDEEIGKKVFHQLLHDLHIPIRLTKNKIRRFYEQKYSEMG
ncbi:CYTH domain-containing protein [Metabacillus litoralis]|uniref:CYTH domain-containing protein n=1 Tax=Metabacillus TaxID=2675233 RepID=UPI001B96F731|nr:CYTH domain-containing protein [Metabacillus litoralis]UHA60245.1 CYTH domain-containing protein [Metabacillus litoralis]